MSQEAVRGAVEFYVQAFLRDRHFVCVSVVPFPIGLSGRMAYLRGRFERSLFAVMTNHVVDVLTLCVRVQVQVKCISNHSIAWFSI